MALFLSFATKYQCRATYQSSFQLADLIIVTTTLVMEALQL